MAIIRILCLILINPEKPYKVEHMKNCEMKVNGNILTITIDISKEFGKSYSGASSRAIIASTEGYIPLPEKNDIKIGLNVYKKA
jgi:hypothetical protein